MKKIILLLTSILCVFTLQKQLKASANEINSNTVIEKQLTNLFEGLPDNKLVVVYPDGSISYTNNVVADYPQELLNEEHAKIMDVSSAKQSVKNILSQPTYETRQTSPGWSARKLKAGETYRSQRFSGKGWRFSGYSFYPALGTGPYLFFRSIGDDGRVGNYNDAMNLVMRGQLTGKALMAKDGWKYFFVGDSVVSANNALGYYTYNPKPGTVYEVHN